MKVNYRKINFCNALSFFGVTVSIYLPQGLFFVNVAGYFSTFKNPLIPLGNVFLLAMLPFVISVFFLAPHMHKVSFRRQLLILKIVRTMTLLFLGVGILMGFEPSRLIYIAILFYDMGFFIYQSISAKIVKNLSQIGSARQAESIGLLGSQFGMAIGGVLASFLLNYISMNFIFLAAAVFEGLGLVGVLTYIERKTRKNLTGNNLPINTINFSKTIQEILKKPEIVLMLLSFALLLPLQQTINFIGGPWAQEKFHDTGQMLGYLVSGIAFGACISSLLVIFYSKFRDSHWQKHMPLLTIISTLGIYFSYDLLTLLIFSLVFGFGFTISRIIMRAYLIDAIEETYVNGIIMMATMLGVALATIWISTMSYLMKIKIMQAFFAIVIFAFFQYICLMISSMHAKKSIDQG